MLSRIGRCVVVSVGPPFHWKPQLTPSRYGLGRDLVWGWVGVHYLPVSFGELISTFWWGRTFNLGRIEKDGLLPPLTRGEALSRLARCERTGGLKISPHREGDCVRCGLPSINHSSNAKQPRSPT